MLSSRDQRINAFFGNRREKRYKFKICDPEAEYEAIKLEKKFNEAHPPCPAKEAMVKIAISDFLVRLRIHKVKHEHQRNNKRIQFFYMGGYTTFKYCYSGYITIGCINEAGDRACFMISDCRDIIEKMVRFDVIKKGFLE
jgi:hypothetical protein